MEDLPHHYPHVQIDVWVIMPNHMHGIIILTEAQATEDDMQSGADPKTRCRGRFETCPYRRHPPRPVRNHQGLQDLSARRINALHNTVGTPFWQRNYYEHVIRNESALDRIRQYIVDNPARWPEDPENPAVRDG